ncbi:MAG: hypothetical protein M0P01_13870 [Treponema sp.]|nr:hypothetical protein [Treponema sp.]
MDKASGRIRSNIKRLEYRGLAGDKAAIAGAGELSCFVWGMMTRNID